MSQDQAAAPPAVGTANSFQDKLRVYLRAGYPLLYVVTAEEDRAIELISSALTEGDLAKRRAYVWSVSRGLCDVNLKAIDRKVADPKRILPFLLEQADPGVFILEDFHFFLDEKSPTAPLIVRQLRDLVDPFKASRKTVILLSPVLKLPPELEKDLTVVDLDMPGEPELLALLDETANQVKDNPKVEINLGEGGREKIVKALTGLTCAEAENALAKVIVTRSRLDAEDINLLLTEKEQIIRKSGMLEFYSTPERFGSIGGLDNLKAWLRQRAKAFSEAARAFGLPNPRGLVLVGVPGCGKSLCAKAVSAEWKMPLLKFDLGKVFGSLQGQSEENMRKALKTAEAVAPCVLWIDEIEKGLSGVRGPSGDSGTTQRVFGTFLTWMEENDKPVFTIATANDIEGLPPELLRKGRFDEVFFIDLPTPQERANVLAIHLTKHHRDFREFDLPAHVAATEGFNGAEIEQAVISALYLAFAEGDQTQLENRHLAAAIAETVPLAKSMGSLIAMLRHEAADKWRRASSEEKAGPVSQANLPEPPPTPQKPKRIFEV
ncbi:MAG: AAA family ATPase [Phycisphaerae bacterium]|nr:AAA family ATPase [Phycisphaerae bacterium]